MAKGGYMKKNGCYVLSEILPSPPLDSFDAYGQSVSALQVCGDLGSCAIGSGWQDF